VAVPLSGLILYFELLLLIISPFANISIYIGKATEIIIDWLNNFILRINAVPHATWQSIQINIPQTIFLYFAFAGFAYWLLRKQNNFLIIALSFLLLFFGMRSVDFIQHNQQQKLIVYNVPQHKAIDIIEGRNYQFIGDSILLEDGFLQNFHLKSSRILTFIIKTNYSLQPTKKLYSLILRLTYHLLIKELK
jgi:competence protein ComEC